MKKLFISLCMAIAVLAQVKANDAELFSYNKNAVETAMSALNSIEASVAQNPALTVNDLAKTGVLLNNFSVNANPFAMAGDNPLGIPPFVWGFCLLGLGVVIVYIATDNDKDKAIKALWGCLAGAVVWVVIEVIIAAAATSTVTNATYTGY